MKLTVLVDNNTLIDQYFLGEPAVSYYIEDENERILFDTGYSDVLIHNANKLHIDLNKITKFDVDTRLKSTIQYFVENNISKLYPCHCVSFKVKAEINSHIPICEIGAGFVIEI